MEPTAPHPEKPLGLRPRVLIVDDDRDFVEYLRDTLTAEFEVFAAATPGEALRLFAQHAPGLVIADQCMPEMSGLDLLARIKATAAATVRIIVTGQHDTDVVVRALNEELVWRYFRKPFDHEAFLRAVRAARDLLMAGSPAPPAAGFLGC